uniref:Uncharacterized protein n=1 Tax=Timema bartmani TaxID=61472 RepID=A0A7R9F3F3_9NEOP|nr:unnamed protein product [Timema bartmani]
MSDNEMSAADDTKRKRGRPAKAGVEIKEVIGKDAKKRGRSAADEKKEVKKSDGASPAKRGRGRPKGSTKKKSKASPKKASVAGRGRGRPKREEKKEDIAVEDEEEDEDEEEEEAARDEFPNLLSTHQWVALFFSHWTRPGSGGGYLIRWFLSQKRSVSLAQSESGYPTRVRHLFESAIKLSYVMKEQYCLTLSLHPSPYLPPRLTLPGLPHVPPRLTLPELPHVLPRLTLPGHPSVPPRLMLPEHPSVPQQLTLTEHSRRPFSYPYPHVSEHNVAVVVTSTSYPQSRREG